MIPRAHYRELGQVLRSAIRAEFTPVLARMDALTAALEAHLQYPTMIEDRGKLLAPLRAAIEGTSGSINLVVDTAGQRLASEAGLYWKAASDPQPRHRRKPTSETPTEPTLPQPPAVAPEPASAEPPAAGIAPEAMMPEPEECDAEALMREWLAQDLRRGRMPEDGIERRMIGATTKNLFAACNARRAKFNLPPFKVPA